MAYKSGNLVRKARYADPLNVKTQEEVAGAVNLAQTTISNWEGGRHLVSAEVALKVADFLGIDQKEMLDALSQDRYKESQDRIKARLDPGLQPIMETLQKILDQSPDRLKEIQPIMETLQKVIDRSPDRLEDIKEFLEDLLR